MKHILLAVSALALLSACGKSEPDPAPDVTPPPEMTAIPDIPVPEPETAEMPSTSCNAVSLTGYCGVEYGMSAKAAKVAYPDELNSDVMFEGDPLETACYYLNDTSGEYKFGFMVEGGSVLRVDVRTPDIPTDLGAKVGMTRDQILALYPNATSEPNKYTPEIADIIVQGENGAKLVFLFTQDQILDNYHAGISPGVDYVEGCS